MDLPGGDMFSYSRWLVSIAALLMMAASPLLFAATQNAVLYGVVYDAAGNPAAGVSVSLENAAIGMARSTVTDSDGSYNFAEVPPAENYTLSAKRGDRKVDIRSGITVNVGDERVSLPPLKELPVATASNPEVAPRVMRKQTVNNETVSTAISGVITGEQLRSLPVALNRNFLNAGLIPSNTHDVEQGSPLAGASFSVAGNRPATNSFLLDGVDNVASSSNQAVPFQVNDAVQEFRITSGTANAEYGRNAGGTVNIVTRRGGNGFHGSTFGYFNNDMFNSSSPLSVYSGSTFDKAAAYAGPVNATAKGFFPQSYNEYVADAAALGFCTDSVTISGTAPAGTSACSTPTNFFGVPEFGKNSRFDPASLLAANNRHNIPFDSKQFGVNMGGPLVKDKWFIFGSYEGTRINNPSPIFERVPADFDRTYDPLGSGAFQFAQNNSNYQFSQRILGLFPHSNVVGVPGVLEFFRGEAPNYTNVNNYLLRSDFVANEKTNLTGRYVVQQLNQLHDDTLPRQANYSGNGIMRDAINQNLDLTYSHSFSSAWITELRTGYNRFAVDETSQDKNFNSLALGMPSGFMPAILLNGIDAQTGGAGPGLNGALAGWSDFRFSGGFTTGTLPTLDGLFPFARLGAPLGAPLNRRDTTTFLASNTSWSHGKHGVKFGAEYRHLNNNLTDGSFTRGFMYSGNIGEFTSDSETCNQLCAFSTGGTFNAFRAPSFDFYQAQADPYKTRLHSFAMAGFIQDTWHVNPRVTLNAGVRYEYFSRPKDKDDNLWNFDPVANGLVQANHAGVQDPYGNPCSASTGDYPSLPAALAGTSFSPSQGSWNCNSLSGHANQIIAKDTNNFAPRVGFAWDVCGSGRTVVRAGVGWFFDQLPSSYISQLMFNRPISPSTPNALFGTIIDAGGQPCCPVKFIASCGIGTTIVNPAVQASPYLPDTVNNGAFYSAAAQPFAMYARDTDHSDAPYTRQLSATIQQQLTDKLTMEVGYIGNDGTNLPVVYHSNLANEANLLANSTGGYLALFPIYTMTNQAGSSYHALLLRMRANDWHGLRVNGTYNYSKSIDNASNGIFPALPVSMPNLSIGYGVFGQINPIADCLFLGNLCQFSITSFATGQTFTQNNPLTLPTINFSPGAVTTTGAGQVINSRYTIPQDPFNFLRDDRGRSDFDQQQRVVIDYTWDVPSLSKNHGWSKWLDYWQLSGVFTASSGQPFTIFAGPIAGEVTQRVNVTGPVQVSDKASGE